MIFVYIYIEKDRASDSKMCMIHRQILWDKHFLSMMKCLKYEHGGIYE